MSKRNKKKRHQRLSMKCHICGRAMSNLEAMGTFIPKGGHAMHIHFLCALCAKAVVDDPVRCAEHSRSIEKQLGMATPGEDVHTVITADGDLHTVHIRDGYQAADSP